LDPSTIYQSYGAGRINWIFGIIFLYLKFPEEIPNEQSATPKRETFVQKPEGALVTCGLLSNSFLLFIIGQDLQDITGYFIFYFHNFPDESDEE